MTVQSVNTTFVLIPVETGKGELQINCPTVMPDNSGWKTPDTVEHVWGDAVELDEGDVEITFTGMVAPDPITVTIVEGQRQIVEVNYLF